MGLLPSPVVMVAGLVSMVVMVAEGTPLDTLQPVSYSGWKVLDLQLGEAAERVTVADSPRIDLNELDDASSVHVLTQNRRTGSAEIAVSPTELPRISQHLDTLGVRYTIKIDDLGRRIKEVEPVLRAEADLRGGVTFSRYMTYDEIKAHVEGLPGRHPQQVKVEVAGRSVEGRPIHLITITDNVANAYTARKPVIFIDGGIHAREWVSPASVLGVVDSLLRTPKLTAGLEWRIIPLVNPDGYLASWQKDRLWRKNTAKTSGSRCVGVDLNRNFGYHWGETGSSGRACSTIYRGPYAFSEPEAATVRDAVLKESSRIQAYITFHSYGQMILHPWGYTSKVKPNNNNKLDNVGNRMAQAIKKTNGVEYVVGSAAGVLYAAAGGSDDWAAGAAKIPLSFTIELRDTGNGGFLLPSSQIQPTVDDAWLAMKTLGEEILGQRGGASSGARPAFVPRQGEEERAEEEEIQEPAEGNQALDQTPGKRKESPVNTNQELVHIILPAGLEQEPVNRNEEQEDFNQGQENLNQGQELDQEPVNRNEEQESLNQGQESVNQGQQSVNQYPVNRDEEQGILNQGQESVDQGQQIINKEPVIKNEGQGNLNQGQEGSNQGVTNINQAEGNQNQEPVDRDEGASTLTQETDNRNQAQGVSNQGTDNRNQEPVIRDQEPAIANQAQGVSNQGTDNRNQEPVIRNQEPAIANQAQENLNQGTDNRNQEPVIRNQEPAIANQPQGISNQATDNRNQEPVIRNQEPIIANQPQGISNQATDNRNQRPVIRDQAQGNLNQDSFEAFDRDAASDSNESSIEPMSPPSSGAKFRTALQSPVEPFIDSYSIGSSQDTIGRGLLWVNLGREADDTSEEGLEIY